jgi:hypothetical protein
MGVVYPCKHDPICSSEEVHLQVSGVGDNLSSVFDLDTNDPLCECGYPGYACHCEEERLIGDD